LNANSVDGLAAALNAVILRLKHSYQLGFHPSADKSDGSYHNLKVKLNSKAKCSACTVQARKGYYAGGHVAAVANKIIKAPKVPPTLGFGMSMTSSNATPLGLFLNEVPFEVATKYVTKSDFERQAALMISARVSTNFVSQNVLAGIKKSWTDVNNPFIFHYLRALIAKINEEEKYPPRYEIRKHMDFTLSASRLSETEDKQTIQIDLKFDANQLLFFFSDERYKSWLIFTAAIQKKLDIFFNFYETSYSEEEVQRALQSGIPLSFTMQIPAADKNIKLIVLNPISSDYGFQSAEIRP
jgi:hypothetical protein